MVEKVRFILDVFLLACFGGVRQLAFPSWPLAATSQPLVVPVYPAHKVKGLMSVHD